MQFMAMDICSLFDGLALNMEVDFLRLFNQHVKATEIISYSIGHIQIADKRACVRLSDCQMQLISGRAKTSVLGIQARPSDIISGIEPHPKSVSCHLLASVRGMDVSLTTLGTKPSNRVLFQAQALLHSTCVF